MGILPPAVFTRTRLTANTVWYVRQTGGSDANDGRTFGTAFQTLQRAADAIGNNVDDRGFAPIIQMYAGTYDGAIFRDGVGGGQIWITGNAAIVDDVKIIGSSKSAIQAAGAGTRLLVTQVEIGSTTSGNGLHAVNGGEISFNSVEFSACAGSQIQAESGGIVIANGDYTISAGAVSHLHAPSGIILLDGRTVTLTGTPAYSAYFAGLSDGYIQAIGTTFSGAATGSRHVIHYNSSVRTNTNNVNFFPGSFPGTINKGSSFDWMTSDILSLTANTTLTQQNATVLANATSGAITLTLGAASASNGVSHTVIKTDASANAVTLDANGSETINGALTLALTAQWQRTTIRCDGTAWYVVG